MGSSMANAIRTQNEYTLMLRKSKVEFEEKFSAESSSSAPPFDELKEVGTVGSGAFGRVVLYQNKKNQKTLVLKILSKARLIEKNQVNQALNERRILSAAKSPFLVGLLDSYKDNDAIYFAMTYESGGDLNNYLRKVTKMDEVSARFVAAQTLLAVEYLHAMDVVHRDIKPENILIGPSGYIKLTDLGLSKMVTGRIWSFCGTPEYIAPEIIMSKGYGKSVDYWALGILIYEMSTGRTPFYKDNHDPIVMYESIMEGKFAIPSKFSKDLEHLLFCLIEVDTTQRYGNLKDGIDDIKTHKWFKGVDFLKLFNQQVETPKGLAPRTDGVPVVTPRKANDPVEKKSSKCLYEAEFREF